MEKLIKIQSIINQIEDLENLKADYRSKFSYKNEWTLLIETYCTDKAISYYKVLDGGEGFTAYIENANVKILEHMKF